MIRLQGYGDARLVRRVLGGTREAFDGLARRYYPAVYGLAYSQTGNWSDAEDVAQEALLRAYRRLDSLKDPRSFGPWLMRIVRNAAFDVHARRRRDGEAAANSDYAQTQAVGVVTSDVESRELSAAVRARVMALEEGPREILLLRYFSGKSLRELAAILQISPNAANKRLQRAREELGQALLQDLGGPVDSDAMESRAARALGFVAAADGGRTSRVGMASTSSWVGYGAAAVVGCAIVVAGLQVFSRGEVGGEVAPGSLEVAEETVEAVVSGAQLAAAIMGGDGGEVRGAVNADVESIFTNDLRDVVPVAPRLGRISGRLVDAVGVGLGGWTILTHTEPVGRPTLGAADSARTLADVVTDDAGQFRMDDVGPGTYEFHVRTEGVGWAEYWIDSRVTLAAGEHRDDLLFVFDPSLRVWGTVSDSQGKPIAGADVQFQTRGNWSKDLIDLPQISDLPPRARSLPRDGKTISSSYGKTDANGHYELFVAPRLVAAKVVAGARDRGYLDNVAHAAPPYGEFNIVLPRVPIIRGRIVDRVNGKPVPAYRLTYTSAFRVGEDHRKRAAGQLARVDISFDPRGEFELLLFTSPHFRSLGLGIDSETAYSTAFVLFVDADGYAATAKVLDDVQPDEVIDDVIIALEPVAMIEGEVRTAGGAAVEGALIRGGDSSRSTVLARTDDEGRFRLDQSDPLMTVLTAYKVGYAKDWAEVKNNRADFVLDEGGVLEIEVLVGGVGGVLEREILVDGQTIGRSRGATRVWTIFPGGVNDTYGRRWRDEPYFRIKRASRDIVAVAAEWTLLTSFLDGEFQQFRLERPVSISVGEMNRVRFDFDDGYGGELTGSAVVDGVAVGGGEVAVVSMLPDGDVLTVSARIRPDGSFDLFGIPLGPFEGVVSGRDGGDGRSLRDEVFSGVIVAGEVFRRDVVFGLGSR